MPRYYNKTRGPLCLSLPSGSTVIAAKTYMDISPTDEGCASVGRYVRKGFLAAPKIRPASVEAAAPAPVPEPDPEPETEPASEEEEGN